MNIALIVTPTETPVEAVRYVPVIFDERPPTGRMTQTMMIAATIPFAVLTPPIAGVILGGMVLLRWDLRRELAWWGLAAAGLFLPIIYIFAAVIFPALGGTRSRPRYRIAA
jgi:hypothetical protein